jgi:hypothetical protein
MGGLPKILEFFQDRADKHHELGQGASTWVINMRAATRSVITYGMFAMFMFVEIFGFYYAWHTDVAFNVAMDQLWDDETQIIWACVVSFWFGGQAFKSK